MKQTSCSVTTGKLEYVGMIYLLLVSPAYSSIVQLCGTAVYSKGILYSIAFNVRKAQKCLKMAVLKSKTRISGENGEREISTVLSPYSFRKALTTDTFCG